MAIRLMTGSDALEAERLCASIHWPYATNDFRRLLSVQPDGCFCAAEDGRYLGQAIALLMGDVGVIGVVAVREDGRGRGLGTELTRCALDFLVRSGATQVKLDATDMGIDIYRRLGWKAVCSVYHLSRRLPVGDFPGATQAPPSSRDELLRVDAAAYGAIREQVLAALGPDSMLLGSWRGTELDGYGMIRETAEPDGVWLGPFVALTQTAGKELVQAATDRLPGRIARLGVPETNEAACDYLTGRGFELEFSLTRMYFGDLEPRENLRLVWAEAGHEKG